ncbi:hypothetical protein, partial [Pseudomonas viridiflava]|uniref:hypothetical protein n=1 Tax=Pseudomonas viridiflava TaxID=33069 RepID=UPI001980AA0C
VTPSCLRKDRQVVAGYIRHAASKDVAPVTFFYTLRTDQCLLNSPLIMGKIQGQLELPVVKRSLIDNDRQQKNQ